MAAASLLAVSCDLDKKPLANLSPDSFFSTRSELDAFANNFYSIFPASSIFEEESDLIIKIDRADWMRIGCGTDVQFRVPAADGLGHR